MHWHGTCSSVSESFLDSVAILTDSFSEGFFRLIQTANNSFLIIHKNRLICSRIELHRSRYVCLPVFFRIPEMSRTQHHPQSWKTADNRVRTKHKKRISAQNFFLGACLCSCKALDCLKANRHGLKARKRWSYRASVEPGGHTGCSERPLQ